MRVDGVLVGALVNDQAVSHGAQRVHGAWLVIGDAVDRGDDGPGGGGQDLLPVNKVIFVAATGVFVREVAGTFANDIGGTALARRGDVVVDLFVVAAPNDIPLASKRKLHGGAAARDGRRVGRRTGSGRGHGEAGNLLGRVEGDFEIPRSALGRHSHDGGEAGDLWRAGSLQLAGGGHKSAEKGSGLLGRQSLPHLSVEACLDGRRIVAIDRLNEFV